MFSILNVTPSWNKKTKTFTNVKTDTSMIYFYSQTLELISKFFKEVGCQEKQSLKILQEFLKLSNSSENLRLQSSRMNLLDDLRFLIISNLDDSPKENKKILENLHSLLHLIALVKNERLSPFYILNTWLNSNSLLKDENEILHAMRGNIGNLVKLYPECREAFEEISKIESHFRNKKISDTKYKLFKDEWEQKYKNIIPPKIRKIFMKDFSAEFHWTEILCYKLAYGNTNDNLEDTIKNIRNLIPENDELYFILINDYNSLIKNASGWTKLIYCLIYKLDDRSDIYESIISIGLNLFDVDWQVSLDYFSFTMYSDHYFNSIISKLEMNPVIFDFLFRYANRNDLSLDGLFKTYASSLLKTGDFLNYLNFINTRKIKNYEISSEFVKFLLLNLSKAKKHFTEEFLNSPLGEYLMVFDKLTLETEKLTIDEILFFINHHYTAHFINLILDNILELTVIPEIIIIKFLDLILYRQRDLLLNDREINNYKIQMINKLQFINQQ
ncbi:uncharacterized protein VNE69_07131 [Vairimorpha necatrix]|uniref:Uncharacterized protein n=1 Tax=Vairimorpha necatrix TaxID=6039 RepID=A0AAX4JDM8_9MICR